jgi:3-dehydroquinate synthase
MQTLNVALAERSYPIHIGAGLLARPELIVEKLPQKRAVIITNTIIAPLYLAPFQRALEARGVSVVVITLADGESHKNWETLNHIFDALLNNHIERGTTLIALGGGVIGDLAGFAAAVYRRGVPYIQVPTTLLAQVDSSVGGKTAINHPLGKNMVGAFYQPLAVISDTDTLATLPPRELAAGLAEVVKYGLIRDRPFFEWLEGNMPRLVRREAEALAYAIERCCFNKAEVVATDERESGPRALLNFGHTFGHAIEAGAGYGTWLHGEAVGAGMLLATRLAQRLGLVAVEEVKRVRALLKNAGLPLDPPEFGLERYLELMGHDKKVKDGRIRFVLLKRIGEAFVTDQVPRDALADTLSTGALHARA